MPTGGCSEGGGCLSTEVPVLCFLKTKIRVFIQVLNVISFSPSIEANLDRLNNAIIIVLKNIIY